MTTADLQSLLDRTMSGDGPHAEKITVAAAVLSEVLRRRGMEATLVGGGAIEFYAPEKCQPAAFGSGLFGGRSFLLTGLSASNTGVPRPTAPKPSRSWRHSVASSMNECFASG